MNNLVLLLACFSLGVLLRKANRLPTDAHLTINALVVQTALPALALKHLHAIELRWDLLQAVCLPWVAFVAAAAFFTIAGRAARWSRQTIGTLILTAGLANTSFVGVPMIEAFFGKGHVGVGIVVDQLGSYLILSTLGIIVAVRAAGQVSNRAAMLRKIVTFPPLIAVVVACLLRPFDYPDWLVTLLGRLGDLVAPLALLSVGCQLRLSAVADRSRALMLGLSYKLVLAPAALTLVLVALMGQDGNVLRIALFEAAMPPMIGAAIVATDHRLDSPLAALMVGIGVPLSFATLPAWSWLLTTFC